MEKGIKPNWIAFGILFFLSFPFSMFLNLAVLRPHYSAAADVGIQSEAMSEQEILARISGKKVLIDKVAAKKLGLPIESAMSIGMRARIKMRGGSYLRVEMFGINSDECAKMANAYVRSIIEVMNASGQNKVKREKQIDILLKKLDAIESKDKEQKEELDTVKQLASILKEQIKSERQSKAMVLSFEGDARSTVKVVAPNRPRVLLITVLVFSIVGLIWPRRKKKNKRVRNQQPGVPPTTPL